MPILTNDLRSPDERRSDQLTILKRRQPPPRSAGRFFKTLADTTTSIGAFDPAFDSDAETDGPTSGSSIWRREFSRVRSASSTSIGLMIDEKRIPSFETKKTLPNDVRGIDRVASRKESEDSFVFEGFVRDRATSFYGKENDVVEVVGEGMSPVSEKTLREELEEDYDMFYHRKVKGKENESPNKSKQTSESESRNVEDVKREHGGVVAAVPTNKKTNESARSEESDKAARSLESGVGSTEEGTQSESLHTLKRFRLNDEPDRFTVSIVSDENSDEDLEQASDMVRYQCGKIPLFVEEIGRVPRAVIIDGKVTRVRVMPERGSFRQAVSKARRSSFGWAFKKNGWFRRRKSVGDRGELRRSGWWNMKRLLFRHGSDGGHV